MLKNEYKEYLKSKHWKNKRKEFYKTTEAKCSWCGETKNLNLHHLTYDNIGNEKLEDLICLCASCHKKLHQETDKFKVKRKPIKKKKNKIPKRILCPNCKYFNFGYYCERFKKAAPYTMKINCKGYRKG